MSPQTTFREIISDPRIQEIRQALPKTVTLYAVGGAIRDILANRPISDIDLASNASPEELTELLERAGLRVIPTGLRHQTVSVLSSTMEHTTEITSFRTAGISATNARSFGSSIEEDLLFRDFTINAMALDLENGHLIDPCNGEQDVTRGIVRAVGEPRERFNEDPLRLMRMVRIASEMNFRIEDETWAAGCSQADSIRRVAIERIRDEFSKILSCSEAASGIRLLERSGLLAIFAPELAAMSGFDQNEFHHLDLFEHSLAVVADTENDLILRLAALLHDVGKVSTLSVDEDNRRHFYKHEHVGADISVELLERLKYPQAIIKAVTILVRLHMRPLTAGAAGLRRLLRDVGEEYERWRELKEADAKNCLFDERELRTQLHTFDEIIEEIRNAPDVSPLKNLALSGSDILSLGIAEGPIIGEVLRALHEQVLDSPSLNTKEQLLPKARELLNTLSKNASDRR